MSPVKGEGKKVCLCQLGTVWLVGAIADLEHAISQCDALTRALSRWRMLCIAVALMTYRPLALHIWNGAYLGLRWLR